MKRKTCILFFVLILSSMVYAVGGSDVFVSIIQKNYKNCAFINLTYLNGIIPAVVPIKTEKLTSLTVTGEVMKIFYKDKDTDSFELYQALNSIYNVMIFKDAKKGDTMTIFFGESKFSKELCSVIEQKYKSCTTLSYMNPTLNAPIPIKIDNIEKLSMETDFLHIETKDKWSVYQALSGLNYILYTTVKDNKKNTSSSNIVLFNFGDSESKTIGNAVAKRFKECDTITSFNVPLPPISIKDVKNITVNNGIVNVEYLNGAFIYQSFENLENITIKKVLGKNNMFLTF